MEKLTRVDIKKLEQYWMQNKEYEQKMKFREWELLTPYREKDTNIGGGRSSFISDTTFQKASILLEDKLYNKYRDIVDGIKSVYASLDETTKKIVDMRYWDETGACYEWEDIADELYMSRNKVLRKRNAILQQTAIAINYI